MHSPKTPWLQILTFAVLLAILGCLIVIIAQQRAITEIDRIVQSSYVPQTIVEASPAPEAYNGTEDPASRPPVRLPPLKKATNAVVAGAPPARSSTVSFPPRPTIISQVDQIVLDPQPVFPTPVLEEVIGAAVVDSGNGSIRGKITLEGSPPPEISIDFRNASDAICGNMHSTPATTRHYVVSSDHGLGNVLVYIKSGLEKNTFRIPTTAPVLDNVTCFFEPYVLAVQAGQTFEIRNSDPTMHNIHATSTSNSGFNLALPLEGMVVQKRFPNPELFIRINCDVHPWMFAYVSVLPHPFFAVSDKDGNYTLPTGLPRGTYVLAARHHKAGEIQQTCTVGSPAGTTLINFSFSLPSRLTKL